MGGWVDQWLLSGQITKNWINLNLINIIMIFEDTPTYGWVYGWLGRWVGGWWVDRCG